MAITDLFSASVGGVPYSGAFDVGSFDPPSVGGVNYGSPPGVPSGADLFSQAAGMGVGYGTGKGLTWATGQSPYSLDAASWFKGADTAAIDAIERAPASFDWANLAGGLVDFAANAGAGYLGSQLGTWGEGNAGSNIGGSLGGAAGGFFFGPAGSFLGSAIGSAIGGNFGPAPTVGPNGQVWLGVDDFGYLDVMGASGDNGITPDMARGFIQPALEYANQYGPFQNLPSYFQVRAGEDRMQPTIEIGNSVDDAYLAPLLNEMSLARTLAARGFMPGVTMDMLGGADPVRIFTGSNWVEPESIHQMWRGGVFTAPGGYEALDTGRVGNVIQDAIAAGVPIGEASLAQFAQGYDPAARRGDWRDPGLAALYLERGWDGPAAEAYA